MVGDIDPTLEDGPVDGLAEGQSVHGGVDWSTVSAADSLAALYGWQAAPGGEAQVGDEVVVPPSLAERLEAFARTSAPYECCGIGIGPAGRVAEFHPVPNVHEEPVTRYQIDAADQLRIFKRADEQGWDITFVFHTHPATEAYPSATDKALAAWPDATYGILSLAEGQEGLRAYRILGEDVTELPVR